MKFFLLLLLCFIPVSAKAQVFVNQAALDQLAGISPHVATPVVMPVCKPVVHHVFHRPVAVKPAVVVAKPAPATAAPVVPVPVVAKPVPLPPLPQVTLSFATGSADLPANAADALKPVCGRAKTGGSVGIDAYAAGDPSDPSVAMRLSLSRALAVRDALTACGVPATQIVSRAWEM